MKRIGNLFYKICDYNNLLEAHNKAKKGKTHYREIQDIDANLDHHLCKLQLTLMSGEYRTSPYKIKTIQDKGKQRTIHVLPYFPDRIVHHAIMNICNEKWERSLIRDTFQSIKKRGTSDAFRRIKKHIKRDKPKYYLQVDIEKYYPNIDNEILKSVIRRSVKCAPTLTLLDEIIDSTKGVPIGNYLSQIFGNLYLSQFDWWVKQHTDVKGYFRYCDDLVFTHNDKAYLHQLRHEVESQLATLNLNIKPSWRITDLSSTGLDFVGYVFRSSNIALRRRIGYNFRKAKNPHSLCSYWGWIKPLASHSLWYHKIEGRHHENRIAA